MKSLLKRVKGCLKLSVLPIPFLLVAAGIGGAIATGTITGKKIRANYEQFRNNEIVQEYIAHEQSALEEKYQAGEIDSVDYLAQKDDIGSDDFIYEIIHNDKQLSELAAKDNKARSNIFFILLDAAPLVGGVISFASLYLYSSSQYYDKKRYKQLIDSAKEDFQGAKDIKDLENKNRELDEYKEEVL